MKQLIPQQFLFRFAFKLRYLAKIPRDGAKLLDLPAECSIPFLGAMDSALQFADVRMAWNESGLAVQWEIVGKRETLYGEPGKPKACDGLSLWLDTRDTRTIHRASRYCHRFVFAAHNGQAAAVPEISQLPIHRALEEAPLGDLLQARVGLIPLDDDGDALSKPPKKGITSYRMEVFLPASVLNGFDPETNSRLGFFYRVRDHEMGDQILAAGPDLPYWEDPSIWQVLELSRE